MLLSQTTLLSSHLSDVLPTIAHSVIQNPPNMEHEHRHKQIRSKMVLLLVFSVFLFFPLADSRSVRGCEEESHLKEGKSDDEKKNSKEEQGDLLTFTLLHVNDIHSHFEEVNVNTGTCKVKLSSDLVRFPD